MQGLLLALDRPRPSARTYYIGNDQPLTQEQLLRAIAEEIGVPPPRLHVPYSALYATAYLAERAVLLTHSRHKPILTRLGVTIRRR